MAVTTNEDALERPGPAVLGVAAALSAGAGFIHIAMVPPHVADSAVLAVGFALSGWFQIASAIAVLVRPTRAVFAAVAAANAVFAVVWLISRTAGLPFGSHAGTAEAAAFVDLAALGLELGLVVLCGALVARPTLGARWGTPAVVIASLPAIGALVLATVAVTSPSATDHHGSSEGGHSHGDGELAAGVHEDGHHDAPTYEPLDAATQQQLSAELELARQATLRYPTVADAKAAGSVRLNVFTPGSGAHYTMPIPGVPVPKGGFNLQAIMGNVKGFDAANPPILLYSGNEDTSVVVGLMYVTFQEEEPEGFAGNYDVWHRHQGVCAEVTDEGGLNILLPIEKDTTKEQCDAVGGNHMPITPWMVHVWTAPGWESPQGVFSHENPRMVCTDGTAVDEAYDFSKGCRGFG